MGSPFPPILVASGVRGAQIAESYVDSNPLSALVLVSPTTPPSDVGIWTRYEPEFPIAMMLRPEEEPSRDEQQQHPLMETLEERDSLFICDGDPHGLQGYELVKEWMDERGL
jgi:hypothetical protein